MDIMTHTKFHFNRMMLTLIFGIRASEPPRAWRTTDKAGPDRVKPLFIALNSYFIHLAEMVRLNVQAN